MSEQRPTLLSVEQFREYARPTSLHLDEIEVMSFVRECEDKYIIPAIGYGIFKAAVGQSEWKTDLTDTFIPDTFLDGGEWHIDYKEIADEEIPFQWGETDIVTIGECEDGAYYCAGLRKTLAYFVYARMLRADGAIITRAGAMRHRDEYGEHVDDTKLKQYGDVMGMAEQYLSQCIFYLKQHTQSRNVRRVRSTRSHIHAIGD